MLKISDYKTIIFDCDGVILDSNRIKTEAYYDTVVNDYGVAAAKKLLEYHQRYGGISRFHKFEYFLKNIIKCSTIQDNELQRLIENYGKTVLQKLFDCNFTDGFLEFFQALPKSAVKIVVSGGLQTELISVFEHKNLQTWFAGIFGSPDNKIEILTREIKNNLIIFPALFLGDSEYDYISAVKNNIDFVFVTKYTEFKSWREFFADKQDKIKIVQTLKELI